MPRLSTSDRIKTRVAHLLRRLLDYANQDLEDCDRFSNQLQVRWVDETGKTPHLVVRTKLKYLVELAFPKQPDQDTKEQIRHDLRVLKEFLEILDDNRAKTQGAEDWHFTLKLWHKSTERNLESFEREWMRRKSQPSKPRVDQEAEPAASGADRSSAINHSPAADSFKATFPRIATPKTRPDHNLPNRYHSAFIGSKSVMTRLLKLLSFDHSANLLSVIGLGGVGKTTLVLEAAHRCLAATQNPDAFPGIPTFDAIIFTSAKSQDWVGSILSPRLRPERNLQDIFRVIFRTLNRLDGIPPKIDQQFDQIRDHLARQQTLLIIDNLETLEDQEYVLAFVRELPPTVKVILTSRIRLDLGTMIPVNCLSFYEGLELIQHQAHLKALQLTITQAQAIYQKTGGLPLAIAYALGQAAVYGVSLDAVPNRLTQPTDDLVCYCFEELVQPLREQPAHQLLMSIALFPCPTSVEALAHVAFTQPDLLLTQAGLSKLHQLSLVDLHQGQYNIHSLTRQYSNIELNNNPAFKQRAQQRWVDWYLSFLQPYNTQNWRDWQEYEALEQEWENLRIVIDWCKAEDRYENFKQLWQPLKGYTQIRGHWYERLEWMEWLMQAAEQREDWATVTDTLYNTSLTLFFFNQMDQTDRAIALSQRAWTFSNSQDSDSQDSDLRVDLATHLAALYLRQGQIDQAFQWLDQGQNLLAQSLTGDQTSSRQRVEMLYYKAEIYLKANDYEQAEQLYSEALCHAEAINWQRLIAYLKGWLAVIAIAQNNLDGAEQLLKFVFSSAMRHDDRRCLAACQSHFARIEQARGNLSTANNWAQSAKEGFERLNMKEQAAEMNALLGHHE